MNGYCNQCENHCALNDLHCGRGYSALQNGKREGFEGGTREYDGAHECCGRGRGHHDDPARDFSPPHGRPGSGDRPPFDGRPPHGGMPPHGGRPPFGRPPRPMPDGEMLLERIERAGLPELMELSGRMLHHRPGAGSYRGQNLALSILAGRESLSQRELQQLLGVQPASMSELVSKLERKGLATREKGEDRRGNLLRITEAGRAVLPSGRVEPEEALFSALSEDQRQTLSELLKALLRDWASRLSRENAEGRGDPFE